MDNVKRAISVVRHIAAYCERVSGMVERFGDSIDAFNSDYAYRYACSLCIIQVGELSTHLSDDFKRVYDEVPWKKIKAMRNLFAHNYDQMSSEQTWNTIKHSIPELAEFCAKVIEQYSVLEQPALDCEYSEDLEGEFEDENEDA